MYKTIALTTALAMFATLRATPVAAADVAQLLIEEHYSEAGYEVDLYVTRGVEGDILSEATLTDPATGDAVDVWTDGITVWWTGVVAGELVRGSMAADDIIHGDPASPLFCFTPVTAVICLGAVSCWRVPMGARHSASPMAAPKSLAGRVAFPQRSRPVAVTANRATTERRVAATKTEPIFRRSRHLVFAVIGLAHAPLVNYTPAAVLIVTGSPIWSPQLATANAALVLCFAAFVAWLAFTVFDTQAGVTILPKRWRIGVPLAAWCVVQEIWTISTIVLYPAEHRAVADWWFVTFVRGNEYLFGWSSAVILMHAAAEEIVYRALLLRALEGTMGPMRALLVQALAFELAHAVFYGYGVSGIWFIGGIVLGYAFQRTRSLAVPTLLHAAHNCLFFALVWYVNH